MPVYPPACLLPSKVHWSVMVASNLFFCLSSSLNSGDLLLALRFFFSFVPCGFWSPQFIYLFLKMMPDWGVCFVFLLYVVFLSASQYLLITVWNECAWSCKKSICVFTVFCPMRERNATITNPTHTHAHTHKFSFGLQTCIRLSNASGKRGDSSILILSLRGELSRYGHIFG